MRKLAVVSLIVAALVGLWWSGLVQGAVRRTFLLTTADPDALGQVATTSMEPIEVTLHSRRPEQVIVRYPNWESWERTGRTIDEQITFRVPAAFFSILYLKEGPEGPQEVGFSVWSKKFDPARPDLLKELEIGKASQKNSQNGPVAKRVMETGETVIDFSVSNFFTEKEKHQSDLSKLSRGDEQRPCDTTRDQALSMTVVTIPDQIKSYESCLGGSSRNAANYTKYADDGSIKFVAKCAGDGPKGQSLSGKCRLHGYFRQWPLFAWVKGNAPETWSDTFDNIQQFLETITVKSSVKS